MKSNEFKKILKPLIKQAVREVILEEGILSNIVSEVAQGLQGTMMLETKNEKIDHAEESESLERQSPARAPFLVLAHQTAALIYQLYKK